MNANSTFQPVCQSDLKFREPYTPENKGQSAPIRGSALSNSNSGRMVKHKETSFAIKSFTSNFDINLISVF